MKDLVAVVTTAFDGVRDGEIYPQHFEVGAELTGNLAKAAIDGKLAKKKRAKPPPPPPVEGAKTATELLAAAEKLDDAALLVQAKVLLAGDVPDKREDLIAALQLQAEEDSKKA